MSTWSFYWAGLEPCLGQPPKGGGEIVDLNRNVTEPGADVDRSNGRSVHQLKRRDIYRRIEIAVPEQA